MSDKEQHFDATVGGRAFRWYPEGATREDIQERIELLEGEVKECGDRATGCVNPEARRLLAAEIAGKWTAIGVLKAALG